VLPHLPQLQLLQLLIRLSKALLLLLLLLPEGHQWHVHRVSWLVRKWQLLLVLLRRCH
jgi:hypothetical protein